MSAPVQLLHRTAFLDKIENLSAAPSSTSDYGAGKGCACPWNNRITGTLVYDEGLGHTIPSGQWTEQGQAEPSPASSASASHHSQASEKGTSRPNAP